MGSEVHVGNLDTEDFMGFDCYFSVTINLGCIEDMVAINTYLVDYMGQVMLKDLVCCQDYVVGSWLGSYQHQDCMASIVGFDRPVVGYNDLSCWDITMYVASNYLLVV